MVQNEFVELLLEIGIIGFSLFALLLFGFFKKTKQHSYIWAIAAAFIIQWLFFSGYPNTLHVYIILIGLYVIAGMKPKKS